jgi:uncharacterized membrane protein YgaE (UPF0421/DUF939 family)
MITQAAVTAGIAWWFSQLVLGHETPVFAPIAAILTIGSSFGQRMSRAAEVAVGVALGVFFGDLFVVLLGRGGWQIMIAIVIAMSVATLIGARNLMVTQAGVQAVVVIVIPFADRGFSRWVDALVGCSLALLVAMFAPTAPVRKPGLLAAGVLRECADVMSEIRASLTVRDIAAGDRVLAHARSISDRMQAVDEATEEGVAVVRLSPFLRKQRTHMHDLSALAEALDRLTRNVRVMARRAAVALWAKEEVPSGYLTLMDQVIEAVSDCSSELAAGRMPVQTQERVLAIGAAQEHLELVNSVSAVVILAQLRSVLVDLLEISGMPYAEARAHLPDRK